jgi:CheY-like chemotaxis protein/anti-sigma regulatory factor (Ser/Thr protein kinase)
LGFALEADPSLVRYIKADNGKLRQILINLLGNAVKFTRKGGIALRARSRPLVDNPSMVWLQLEVEDNGPGISPEQQARIFDPFVQTGTTFSTTSGTGLGLAISKSFVELMGGEIGIDSTLDKGSLFRVELPVALAEPETTTEAGATRPEVLGLEPAQPTWRILVVEDNPDNRLLLTSLLCDVGFEIGEAENGEQAVARFEEWRPHFIWMDMRMPVLDGYLATRRIRALPGGDKVKIVALTASAFKDQRTNILESGCDDVLHKPFQAHEIFDVMAEQLGVRYRYGEPAEESAEDQVEVNIEAITALPWELRERIRVAAVSLSSEEFDAALGSVRELNTDLADGLTALAREFRFDLIQELLDKASGVKS